MFDKPKPIDYSQMVKTSDIQESLLKLNETMLSIDKRLSHIENHASQASFDIKTIRAIIEDTRGS